MNRAFEVEGPIDFSTVTQTSSATKDISKQGQSQEIYQRISESLLRTEQCA
jgi:hypothetical protein